jgi:hypothetical protein
MGLAGLGILFVLFIIGVFILCAVLVIVGLVFTVKQIIQKRSVKQPILIFLVGVAIIFCTIIALNLSASKDNSFINNQYASYPYTVFLPSKLPKGYSSPNSGIGTDGSTLNLTEATLYELPKDNYGFFLPPSQCDINDLIANFTAINQSFNTGNFPCTLLTTTYSGTKIYGTIGVPNYVIMRRANTTIILKEDDAHNHLIDISQIVDNLKSTR